MSSQSNAVGCDWQGDLPEFGVRSVCEMCQKLRSAGDVLRCRIRGGPLLLPAASPKRAGSQRSLPCISLGGIIRSEPCSCGAASSIPIFSCKAEVYRRRSGSPGLTVPLQADLSRILDEDARRSIHCCESCDFYQSSAATPDRYESDGPHDPNQSVEP